MPAIQPEVVEQNPVSVPLYTLPDAARYLHVSLWTVLAFSGRGRWSERYLDEVLHHGMYVLADDGEDWPFPEKAFDRLSFRQMADWFVRSSVVHALWGLREDGKRQGRFRLHESEWLFLGGRRPDGTLFDGDPVEGVARLVAGYAGRVPPAGEEWLRKWALLHLDRVETVDGIPVRLFPFSREPGAVAPRTVVLDPRVRFGRPTVAGRGVATDALLDRYQAGDSPAELAEDYGLTVDEVDEAIRYESRRPVPLSFPFHGW